MDRNDAIYWLVVFGCVLALFFVIIVASEGAPVIPPATESPVKVPLTIPKDARLMGSSPFPCGGGMLLYDGNHDPEDGLEFLAIIRSGEDEPRAIIQYGPGVEGVFERAVVRIPGQPEVTFTTRDAFAAAYTDLCEIITPPKVTP